MLKIFLNNPGGYSLPRRRFLAAAKAAGKIKKNLKGVVEVNFVADGEIKKLNQRWRKKKRPTDVLAFAWGETKKIVEGDFLGQIFIAYPWAVRQARQCGQKIEAELVRLLVHGLLHIAGLDHKRPAEAKKMFSSQEKIVSEIFK